MRPTNPTRPPSPPDWRRRLAITAVVGVSTLYCLGMGAYALKRSLVPAGQPAMSLATNATQTPGESSWRPTRTLEPTPTQATLVFPTLAPQLTATLEPPVSSETPIEWPTAVEIEPTATATPTLAPPTPTLEPTATETATPTETPSPTGDHGGGKPTETPTPGQ